MRAFYLLVFLILSVDVFSQDTVKALFLGNSYTHRNNMPILVNQFAKAGSHVLVHDVNAPGGYTLERHSKDATSTNLIRLKKWDFVVLQEQSQLPSFPDPEVNQQVYPAAKSLVDLMRSRSACAMPAFFRTWGRKNGDSRNCPIWPPVCTYEGMDSLLAMRYQKMADTNGGIVIPVGEVWKKIREEYPTIELYKADESHPSTAGSFAAACCFYTCFYREDPTKNSFKSSLNDSTANQIKRLTKWVVYNQFERWNIGVNEVKASYEIIEKSKGKLTLASSSINSNEIKWFVNDTLTLGDTLNLDVLRSGRYKFHLKAIGGCSFDSITFWLQLEGDAVSTDEKFQTQVFSRLENGIIIISTNNLAEEISIFDLTGKRITSFTNTNYAEIYASKMPKFVIVEVRNFNRVERKPIVIY